MGTIMSELEVADYCSTGVDKGVNIPGGDE